MIIHETVHCALVVLGELANAYGSTPVSASQISEANHIPLSIVDEAVYRLIDVEIVHAGGHNYNVSTSLYLTKHPDEIYITDIISLFEKNIFNGYFMDSNGKKLPESELSHCLNILRHKIDNSISSQMRGMSINVLTTWVNTITKIRTSVVQY